MKRAFIFLAAAGVTLAAFTMEESMGLLRAGDRAPDFTAVLSTGERVTLSAFRGKQPLVLFFYPRDETSGCIAEVCSYRDGYGELRRLGAAVLGVSPDGAESHGRFIAHYGLPFPLIADTGGTISRSYGVLRWGRPWLPLKRVTYVIDRDGIIRGVFHHEIRISNHVTDVIARLEGK